MARNVAPQLRSRFRGSLAIVLRASYARAQNVHFEAVMDPSWTDEDKEFVRDHWLAGWDDPHIAPKLGRSRKAIAAMRQQMKLTIREYPNRPEPFGPRHVGGTGRRYTTAESIDILRMFDDGHQIAEIGRKYGVSRRAMECKVDRLLEKREDSRDKPVMASSARDCLGCGRSFFSNLPRSVNRQCQNCKDNRAATGASFLTIY